jgi:hypothetical protein
MRRKLDAMPRCASSDIRAASQGEMNQGLNIVVLCTFRNEAGPQFVSVE